jgi:hypothetical protein
MWKIMQFIASIFFGFHYAHHQEYNFPESYLIPPTHYLPDTPNTPTHTHTHTHTTNDPLPRAVTSLTNWLLAKPPHCNTLHHNTRAHYFAYLFQVWPPKSGSYLLIVLLMMGILVPETCWGNKTAYFVASSWSFTFHCNEYLVPIIFCVITYFLDDPLHFQE